MLPRHVAAILALSVVPALALAQDFNRNPSFGTVNLRANFEPDPVRVNVTAGGTLAAERLGGSECLGSIANAPDVRLNYRAGQGLPLYLSAASNADVTLVVNLPDGRWACNDDFQGTNPGLVFRRPQSGQYDIWIGHYDRGSRVPAQLRISEVPPN
ncbi:peptidase S1 [Falsiroseomonas selenitidurans]|uniref:Peptidase S1 n=1 Tax=Falsiroseomonas selenitidurans TaxID=2716335 RepID=A0ABX1EC02_9PROT|nr:peptidase S1 [Falsiroseomonas selenitidurans]NKC34378.1 peptidase S1 [Falsiroseomonas selenitidurans]